MGSDVKYARSGEAHIAYRVFGDGPRDLVLIPGTLSHAVPAQAAHVLRRRHRLRRRAGRDAAGPARAIRCACAIRDAVDQLGLQVRAGLHTGECEVAGSKVSGIAVHTGARVAAAARPQEVLVSGTVRDLVAGSGIRFDDRGSHVLKGVPGDWRLFAVTST